MQKTKYGMYNALTLDVAIIKVGSTWKNDWDFILLSTKYIMNNWICFNNF